MQTKKKILIVDEDSNYISGLRKGLNQAGHEVLYWDDSKKALELTKNLQPDLIIAEVSLPQINGHEFFKEVKAMPEIKDIPFVFLSSQKRVDDRIISMEIGVDDFIIKPFYVDEVIARIENLLDEVAGLEESKYNNEKGFSGDISEMNLIDLIQTLELGKKSGIIKLRYNNYQGNVYIKNGEIVDATLEDYPPTEALLKISVWTEGNFFVEMADFNRNKTFNKENKELISEIVKQINRWEQRKKNLPPLNTIFTINEGSLGNNSLSEEEKTLLSSLNGNSMIYDIIVKSPFDDIKALEIVEKLYQKGYLQETTDNYFAEPENYLTRIKQDLVKHKRDDNNKLSYIIANLLIKSGEKREIEVDRRKDERRQSRERRRFDRRKDRRIWENEICLDKTELLLIREKLI